MYLHVYVCVVSHLWFIINFFWQEDPNLTSKINQSMYEMSPRCTYTLVSTLSLAPGYIDQLCGILQDCPMARKNIFCLLLFNYPSQHLSEMVLFFNFCLPIVATIPSSQCRLLCFTRTRLSMLLIGYLIKENLYTGKYKNVWHCQLFCLTTRYFGFTVH